MVQHGPCQITVLAVLMSPLPPAAHFLEGKVFARCRLQLLHLDVTRSAELSWYVGNNLTVLPQSARSWLCPYDLADGLGPQGACKWGYIGLMTCH